MELKESVRQSTGEPTLTRKDASPEARSIPVAQSVLLLNLVKNLLFKSLPKRGSFRPCECRRL
jgi:hypothetical protein